MMKSILLACLIATWGSLALAHSPLTATTPANKAVIEALPSEISLSFKGTIRLTRVSVSHEGSRAHDLDLSAHKGFISQYSLPFSATQSGPYTVTWRGLGSDGHTLKGTFSFTVK